MTHWNESTWESHYLKIRVAPKYALYPSPPKRPRYIYNRKLDNSNFSVPFYAIAL